MVWAGSELLQDGGDDREESERAEDEKPHEKPSDARTPGIPIIIGVPPAKIPESGVALFLHVHGHLLCFTFQYNP